MDASAATTYNRRSGTAQRFVERLSNDLTLEMVLIPGGTFLMGSPEHELERAETEDPQHQVTLPSFLMGRYPVTQAQWRFVVQHANFQIADFEAACQATDYAVRRVRPEGLQDIERIVLAGAWEQQSYEAIAEESGHSRDYLVREIAPRLWFTLSQAFNISTTKKNFREIIQSRSIQRQLEQDPSSFKGGNRPVERVSWEDAIAFCEGLSHLTGRSYRLPSEAEWEYACRAATVTPFHFGEILTTELANYNGEDEKFGAYGRGPIGLSRQKTSLVNRFAGANSFGLYAMHGNVLEWCQDVWHDDYNGAPMDGSAWLTSGNPSQRVLRGGSWKDFPSACRSAYRHVSDVGDRSPFNGLRLACSLPNAPSS